MCDLKKEPVSEKKNSAKKHNTSLLPYSMSCLTRSIAIKHSKSISKLITKYNANNISSYLLTHQHRHNSDSTQGFNFNFDDDEEAFSSGYSRSNTNFNRNINQGRLSDHNMFGQKQFKQFSRAQIEWTKENLTPFTKDFYNEHPEISKLSSQEVEKFRKSNSMIIHGSNVPKPFTTFENSGLPGMI